MRWTSAHFISQDNFASSTEKIRSGFVNDNARRVLGWIDWRNIAISLIDPGDPANKRRKLVRTPVNVNRGMEHNWTGQTDGEIRSSERQTAD